MKLSRIAVVLASAAAVLVPAGAAPVQAAGAAPVAPMIFEDPFGFAAAYIDNPRFATLIFENPFDW